MKQSGLIMILTARLMNNDKTASLERRQQVEEAFHDQWAQSIDLDGVLVRESFEAETAAENRYALRRFGNLRGKKLLDLGCGAGETSVYFALQGADVTACDISREMLRIADNLARKFNVSIRTVKGKAEQLDFGEGDFDFVFGNGVLHHVEIAPAAKEIYRILKPGGLAIFIDPLEYNPAIKLYRRIASAVRTETERPLIKSDVHLMADVFDRVESIGIWFSTLLIFVYFYLVERADPSKERYWKKIIAESDRVKVSYRILKKIDDGLLRAIPFLKWYCWNLILVCHKR